MARLAGQIALVTDGASGMGAAIVERFAGEGARSIVADVNDVGGSAVAAAIGDAARFARLGVTDPDAIPSSATPFFRD